MATPGMPSGVNHSSDSQKCGRNVRFRAASSLSMLFDPQRQLGALDLQVQFPELQVQQLVVGERTQGVGTELAVRGAGHDTNDNYSHDCGAGPPERECDGPGAEGRKADEDGKPLRVAAAGVANRRDQHRRGRFRHAVGRGDDPHEPTERERSEQVGGHQRDDHVVAAEADAEQHREYQPGPGAVGEEEQRDRRRHDRVDQNHDVRCGSSLSAR